MTHFSLLSTVNFGYSVHRARTAWEELLSQTVCFLEDVPMAFVAWIIGCSVLILAIYGLVLKRLAANKSAPAMVQAGMLDWLDGFSAARYRPMQRLLSDVDKQFLQSRVGGDFRVARRLRRQRIAIFAQYLSEMRRDFSRLSLAMRELVTCAPDDQSELISSLIGMEWRFRRNLAEVYLRLGLYTLGLTKLDVSPLVRGLESFESGIRQLVQIPATIAA